jgi:predicted nucleic-acid-binding protein
VVTCGRVFVRILVGDDPAQTKKAERAFVRHANGDGVVLSVVVLCEIAWVLATAYGWDRITVQTRLQRLIRTRGVVVEELEDVEAALDAFAVGKADLADYLIAGHARGEGQELSTFDKRLAREKFATLL